MRMRPRYKILEHTADVGIEVEEEGLERALETAVLAMFDLMLDLEKVEPKEERVVEVGGEDLGDLVVSLLEEFLFLLDTEGFVPREVRVLELSLDPPRVRVMARGERADPRRHGIHLEVKAVTRHMLEVDPRGRLRILFDV